MSARRKWTSHLCSFSAGLDDLPKRKQGKTVEVLRVLHRAGRFSEFEASANSVIADMMTRLCAGDLIVTDNSIGYPWTLVTLTDKGLALIGESKEAAAAPAETKGGE